MAGKSTILNLLHDNKIILYGKISLDTDKILSILKQDHHVIDNFTVIDTPYFTIIPYTK